MKTHRLGLLAALALGGLLAFSTVASAQDAKDARKARRGPNAEQQLEQMKEKLKLTEQQVPKVKAVLEERDKKRQEFRDLATEERRDKAMALAKETDKKLKEILTAEQYGQWEKLRDEALQRKGGDRKRDDTKKE